MGIIGEMFGRGSEVDPEDIVKELEPVLIEQEQVEKAYKILRDLVVFTNKRLILIDKQGITAKKKQYLSIPYRSIVYFSKESTGHFDKDAELLVWIRGQSEPLAKSFNKDKSIHEIYQVLSSYVLD